jgi:hypothetical protein
MCIRYNIEHWLPVSKAYQTTSVKSSAASSDQAKIPPPESSISTNAVANFSSKHDALYPRSAKEAATAAASSTSATKMTTASYAL